MSNTEQQRSAICRAITSFGHSISADKVILHRDNGEKDNLLTLIIDAVEKELAALSAQSAVQEPAAWISTVMCIGTDYGKELYGKLPIQSLQAGYYKHTPLYTHPSSSAQDEEIRNAALEEAVLSASAGEKKDAERWRAMRNHLVAVDFYPEMGGGPVVMFDCFSERVSNGPKGADKIADDLIAEDAIRATNSMQSTKEEK